MAEPTIPEKVKLFVGIITNSQLKLDKAQKKLVRKYGKLELITEKIPFEHTSYYHNLGDNLFKSFLAFKKLIKPEKIPEIKLFTNKLEKNLSAPAQREINIDPGYLTLSNIYLASCKPYYHRAYLKKGVYLENELYYSQKKFNSWEWTYPDLYYHQMDEHTQT
jgi:hypothetical protein